MLSKLTILDSTEPHDLSDSGFKPVFREVVADCLSADEVDAEWDRINDLMDRELRQTEERLRNERRLSYRPCASVADRNPKHRLTQLLRMRERQRALFNEACEGVGLLRTQHIELLEWAVDAERRSWAASGHDAIDEVFCTSFSIVLEDGDEVVPCRIRPRGRTERAFFVIKDGNRRENGIDVYTERELRRFVVGLGYRVHCRSRDGRRSGQYSSRSPNKVRWYDS